MHRPLTEVLILLNFLKKFKIWHILMPGQNSEFREKDRVKLIAYYNSH